MVLGHTVCAIQDEAHPILAMLAPTMGDHWLQGWLCSYGSQSGTMSKGLSQFQPKPLCNLVTLTALVASGGTVSKASRQDTVLITALCTDAVVALG